MKSAVGPREGNSAGRPNKGLQLTKAARCAPFAFRLWGQSLRAAFAAEARCWTGSGGIK